MKRFANRIALITGEASGIGEATARSRADEGAAWWWPISTSREGTVVANDIERVAVAWTWLAPRRCPGSRAWPGATRWL